MSSAAPHTGANVPIIDFAHLSLSQVIDTVARQALAGTEGSADALIADMLPPARWTAVVQLLSTLSLENRVLFVYVFTRFEVIGIERTTACRQFRERYSSELTRKYTLQAARRRFNDQLSRFYRIEAEGQKQVRNGY